MKTKHPDERHLREVEVGGTVVEGMARDLALGAERPVVAEVIPQAERDGAGRQAWDTGKGLRSAKPAWCQ